MSVISSPNSVRRPRPHCHTPGDPDGAYCLCNPDPDNHFIAQHSDLEIYTHSPILLRPKTSGPVFQKQSVCPVFSHILGHEKQDSRSGHEGRSLYDCRRPRSQPLHIHSLPLPSLPPPLFSHLSFHSQGRRNPEAHSSHVTDTVLTEARWTGDFMGPQRPQR